MGFWRTHNFTFGGGEEEVTRTFPLEGPAKLGFFLFREVGSKYELNATKSKL